MKKIAFQFVMITMISLSVSLGLAAENNESPISVQDGVICQDVVDRVPVGTGDLFPKETPKLYCFTKVVGARHPTSITHLWYNKGLLQSKVRLEVNSAAWRTWSSLEMSPEKVGEWMVEVVSEDGVALESIIFMVK